MLLLKRIVYINYKKLNILLQTKQSYSLEQLCFSEDGEDVLFKSGSTAPENVNDELDNNYTENNINEELKKGILKSISEVALELGVLNYDNQKDLVLEMITIERRYNLLTILTSTTREIPNLAYFLKKHSKTANLSINSQVVHFF